MNQEEKDLEEEVTEESEEKYVDIISGKVMEEYDGPQVTTYTTYDFRTLKYYNIFSMKYLRHLRIAYLALGALCLGYDVFYLFATILPAINNGEFGRKLLIIPGIFLLFSVYTIYLYFNFEKQIDKNLRIHFDSSNAPLTTIKVKVTSEKLVLTSSSTNQDTSYDWAYVSKICEIPQFYYLLVGRTPIIISKDPNNVTEGNYETLVEIISEQAKLKPYKLVDAEINRVPITYVHKTIVEEAKEVVVEEVENEEVKEKTDDEE